jgi:hypothetical protein
MILSQHMTCLYSYLNMVCTATMVLQSANVSSSAEFDISLFTTTTFSARVIPARSKSSRLKTMKDLCRILGSHSGGYVEFFCLLGYNAV